MLASQYNHIYIYGQNTLTWPPSGTTHHRLRAVRSTDHNISSRLHYPQELPASGAHASCRGDYLG